MEVAVDIDKAVGERVERLRRLAGITRANLAAQADISETTLKFVETGRRSLTLRTAQRLAPFLHVRDLTELYGETVRLSLTDRPTSEAIPEVRRALTAWPVAVTGEPESPDYLRGRLDAAWATWHTSRLQRSETGGTLPGLITDTQRAVRLLEGEQRRGAQSVLAETYHLAQAFLAWHGDRDLCWLTVDRGMTAAMDSDDPLTIAGALWYAAHLLRAVGRSDEALDRLAEARALVEPKVADGPVEYAAMLADLTLCVALTKARAGDQGAWADWDTAAEVIRRALPDGYVHPWTRVGAVLGQVYAVMLAVDLGHTDEAQRRAQDLDPETIPSTERRARHYLELARVADLEGSAEATLHLLGKAVHTSPETVKYSPIGRDMAARLVTDGPAAIRADALKLAETVDVHP